MPIRTPAHSENSVAASTAFRLTILLVAHRLSGGIGRRARLRIEHEGFAHLCMVLQHLRFSLRMSRLDAESFA